MKLDDWKSSPPSDLKEVPAQLDRVLSSHIFTTSPRLQEFLRYVDEETLAGRSAGIDVIAMTSVQPYETRDVSQRQIGDELRVSRVLRGSIRSTEQKLRATAQLFESRTGKQVWGEHFDRPLNDELALQIQLAERVTKSVATAFPDRLELTDR